MVRASCLALLALTLAACERGDAPPAQPATPAPSQPNAAVDAASGRNDGAPATAQPGPGVAARPASSPCLVQGGEAVPPNRLRAIGTEPFWGARIEGRCVTYSHPEDQQGTRVWTRFSGTADNGTWTGALGGRPFELRTRPEQGCSDGMSDRRYPLAVSLTVMGEQRSGCAEPL